MRVALASIAATLMLTAPASAHELAGTDPRVLSAWDLAAAAILIAMAILYGAGCRRLRDRSATSNRTEIAAFWIGWVVMIAAVLPPLDALSLERFSAHMLQHEMLMIVGVPLIVAGRPLAVCLWGIPDALRGRVATVFQRRPIGSAWRFFTAPIVAWGLHGLAVWLWHAPPLYNLAVIDERVHALQHATFVGTAILFWWGLIYGRYGRAGYGASVFFVFTTAVHTGILGALLTFAGSPLYSVYAAPGRDALGDQQLAGIVMWVPAGLVLTLAGIGLFAAWLGEAERRSRHVSIAALKQNGASRH